VADMAFNLGIVRFTGFRMAFARNRRRRLPLGLLRISSRAAGLSRSKGSPGARRDDAHGHHERDLRFESRGFSSWICSSDTSFVYLGLVPFTRAVLPIPPPEAAGATLQ
jgi:hypothetical protein